MTDFESPQQSAEQPNEDRDNNVTSSLTRRLIHPPWLARMAGISLSGVSIGFVVLFLVVLGTGGNLALITKPLPMRFALALPYLIVILTICTCAGAVQAWRRHYWSLTARVHQTILALFGLAFTWQLSTIGFLPL